MAEPIQSPATLDAALAQVAEAKRALKRFRPADADQARAAACELVELQEQAADAKNRATNGSNGHGNGHAPATHEFITELAKGLAPFLASYVKDYVSECAETYLCDEVITALADGLRPILAEKLEPLTARQNEQERVIRALAESVLRQHD